MPAASDFDGIRKWIADILERECALATEFDLPPPPEVLGGYVRKLRDNNYTVLVAGEAKRGKSTFINAILGRSLLPTDVDVATCQVFRIRQSSEEAYRIRFEDDSTQEITAAELPKFGSQDFANADGAPRLRQFVRWIEVEGPIHFLPPTITLLDTPGLGSLYADHGRITRRFVPLADGVIFVLSTDSPISREEVQFIEELLKFTRSLFFIQTMIDRYGPRERDQIKARNEQVLSGTFGERIADRRVWPVSSTNLLKSVQENDVDYEAVSQIRPLSEALKAFLVWTAGWNRGAEAVVLVADYHATASQTLSQRRANLLEESAAARADYQRTLTERRKAFEEAWGPQGLERTRVAEKVQREIQLARREFEQSTRLDGPLHADQLRRIGALESLDEAKRLAETISNDFNRSVGNKWSEVSRAVQDRCMELLLSFREAVHYSFAMPREVRALDDVGHIDGSKLTGNLTSRMIAGFQHGRIGFSMFATGAVAASLILPAITMAPLFIPLAILGSCGAGLMGVLSGVGLAGARQLADAKRALEEGLRQTIRQVHQRYFDVDQKSGQFAVVDEFFNDLARTMSSYLERVAQEQIQEAQSEIDRVTAEAQLSNLQRKEKADRVTQQLATWAKLGDEVKSVVRELESMAPPQAHAVPAKR